MPDNGLDKVAFRVNKSDKTIIFLLVSIFLIDLIVLVFSIINVNTRIYFFAELVFMTILPAIIVYSVVISLANKYICKIKPYNILVKFASLVLYLCFILFNKSYFFNMYSDVPNIINAKYNTVIGKPSELRTEGIKTRTHYFKIDDIMFSANSYLYREQIVRDQNYKITYLQSSKYIINIEKD